MSEAGTRVCTRCKAEKSVASFPLLTPPKRGPKKPPNRKPRKRSLTCRKCKAAQRKQKWREANPDKVLGYQKSYRSRNRERYNRLARKRHYLKRYGITEEERDEILRSQGGKCPICHTKKPSGRNWCVDHDHKTGSVRAILCGRCNSMIGYARESTVTLHRAIAYIEASDANRNDRT